MNSLSWLSFSVSYSKNEMLQYPLEMISRAGSDYDPVIIQCYFRIMFLLLYYIELK